MSLNATIASPSGMGHLTLFPDAATAPATSNLNFGAGLTRANNALVPLATDGGGTLAARVIVAGNGTTHLLLDVNGWFE